MPAQHQLSPDHLLGQPPLDLVHGSSFFLDLDGTLLDLVDRPDEVVADEALGRTLDRLAQRLDGRVAIVSGRSIAQLDRIFGARAATLVMAGSHGGEFRIPTQGYRAPPRPEALDRAIERFRAFAEGREGVLVEDKSFGTAIHYRMAPSHEPEAIALAEVLAAEHGLVLQRGKMMAEVRVAGDKGEAIQTLMIDPAFRASRPIFFGDDLTDEDGFRAVAAMGGVGVLVGPPRETHALYRIDGVAALRSWLDSVSGPAEGTPA